MLILLMMIEITRKTEDLEIEEILVYKMPIVTYLYSEVGLAK